MTQEKICSVVGCVKPGVRRGQLCQMHNWRLTYHGSVHYTRPPRPLCTVSECPRTVKGHGLCQLHLGRANRGLPMDYVAPTLAAKRYQLRKAPGHPVADIRGRVYVHRQVLYDQTNGGRLPCFWCAAPLEWGKNLVVDHLDHDRHNNASTNLVPACNGCNAGRTVRNPQVRTPIYAATYREVGT